MSPIRPYHRVAMSAIPMIQNAAPNAMPSRMLTSHAPQKSSARPRKLTLWTPLRERTEIWI